MRRSMQIASEGPHTYLHGDLHIANTYLTREERAGVADWQVGLRGSWAHDYAYLVATALEIEERRACEQELLDYYLERLAAAGGESIPKPTAWNAYRQAMFYPYFAWVYTLGRSRIQPRFQPAEVSLTLIERIAAAIEDLDSFGAVGL
jgi:aminoglycoside phosphotransferase (APT) family kinase protein